MPDLADPQSLNRYTYCLNNPLKYVDPSGHVVEIYGVNVESIYDYINNYGYYGLEGMSQEFWNMFQAYNIVRAFDHDRLQGLESSVNVVNISFNQTNGGAGGQCLPASYAGAWFVDVLTGHGDLIDWNITIAQGELGNPYLASLLGHELYHASDPFLSDSIQEESNAYNYQDRINDYQDALNGNFIYHNRFGLRSMDTNDKGTLEKWQGFLTVRGMPSFYKTLPLYSPTNIFEDLITSFGQGFETIMPSVATSTGSWMPY